MVEVCFAELKFGDPHVGSASLLRMTGKKGCRSPQDDSEKRNFLRMTVGDKWYKKSVLPFWGENALIEIAVDFFN